MSTAHLQATDAVMAALRTAPAVADKIARGRAVPAQLTADTAAFVRLARSTGNSLALDGSATTGSNLFYVTVDAAVDAGASLRRSTSCLKARSAPTPSTTNSAART